MIAALIVAAGEGRRFSGGRGKAFARLGGLSLVGHCLRTFEKTGLVDMVVLVVAGSDLRRARALASQRAGECRRLVTTGGDCRARSVYRGMAALPPGVETVLVHDAARPLVSGALVSRIAGLARRGPVIPVVPLTDTAKFICRGRVAGTPDRSALALVQTPQGFPADLLGRALEREKSRLENFADDSSLVEALGVPVRAVPGEPTNIKITDPWDLELASVLLRRPDRLGASRPG